MATYIKPDGTTGNYLEQFAQVFRREGKPCPRCGAEIVKMKVAGRGTHVCPVCQCLSNKAPLEARPVSLPSQVSGALPRRSSGSSRGGLLDKHSQTGRVGVGDE